MEKITVLLAEDHTIVRKGLFALLKEADDIEVIAEAADGREAVSMADELHPDVDVDDLVIKTAYSDEGQTLKRFRARAMGRGARILKRTSHITLVVSND